MFHHFQFADFDPPFTVFDALRRSVDRGHEDDTVGPFLGAQATAGWPEVHVSETPDAIVLRADVPGIAEEGFTVTLAADGLTLAGERPPSAPEGYTVQRQERTAAKFSRSWKLPFQVDAEKTTAVLKDGVLTITLAKAASAQPRRITVRAQA